MRTVRFSFLPMRAILFLLLGLALFASANPVASAPPADTATPDWQVEVLFPRGFAAGHTELQVDDLGHNHIVFVDNSTRQLIYAFWGGIGTAWKFTRVADSTFQDWDLSQVFPGFDLTLSNSNVPQIAYEDGSKIYYAVQGSNGAFTTERIGTGRDPAIAFGSGRPRVAYLVNRGDLIYAQRNESGWSQETLPLDNALKEDTSLSLDSLSLPHLAYMAYGGDGREIRYARWTGTMWQVSSIFSGNSPDLALDSQNRPHIAFRSGFGGLIRYAYRNNTSWVVQLVGNHDTEVGEPTLALDGSDTPQMAYGVKGELFAGDPYYAYWDGMFWREENLGKTAVRPKATVSSAPMGFALDPQGNPHLTFTANFVGDLHHVSRASAWQMSEVQSGALTYHTSIEADWNGNPYISYASLDGVTRGLNYALLNPACLMPSGCTTRWSNTTVAPGDAANRGWHNSLAMRSPLNGGDARIASYNPASQDLEYSYQTGTQWQTEPVDTLGDVGKYNSLKLVATGEPYVAYWDATNLRVKYGWKDPTGWHLLTNTASPALNADSGNLSLALTPAGSAHCCRSYISYYDGVNGDLRLATWDGTTWSDRLIDDGAGQDVGSFNALAYSTMSDKLVIAYYKKGSELWVAEGITETWTIDRVFQWNYQNPLLDLSDLRVDGLSGGRWFAYITEDNAVHLLSKKTLNADWLEDTILPADSFPRRDISLATGGDRLHLVLREGQLGALSYYASASTVRLANYNPLQPCFDVPSQPAAVRFKGATFTPRAPSAEPMYDLDILRGVRDLFATDTDGQHYIDLYYQHAPETGAIGLRDPDLMLDTFDVLQKFLPGFEALITGKGDDIVISQALVDAANNIADRLVAAASPALGAAINQERGKYHNLQDFVGLTFRQGSGLLGVPAPLQCTARPPKPNLRAPANGANLSKSRVRLKWAAASCATRYQVLVKQDSKRGPVVARAKNVTETQFKTKPLAAAHTYFWRVKACNAFGCRGAKWRSFTVLP